MGEMLSLAEAHQRASATTPAPAVVEPPAREERPAASAPPKGGKERKAPAEGPGQDGALEAAKAANDAIVRQASELAAVRTRLQLLENVPVPVPGPTEAPAPQARTNRLHEAVLAFGTDRPQWDEFVVGPALGAGGYELIARLAGPGPTWLGRGLGTLAGALAYRWAKVW